MNKYIIERPIPGIGNSTRDELHLASLKSAQALDELGPDIQWVHSYVTDDKIYCVYLAANEHRSHRGCRRCLVAVGGAADRARHARLIHINGAG